jgi:EVE domain
MAYWVWVFGEVEGLRWVREHERMAFQSHAASRLTRMHKGDRAVLYVTRGAHHNPTRDVASVAGLATVASEPSQVPAVEIAGMEFSWLCSVQFDTPIVERAGPSVANLIDRLKLIQQKKSWGVYFRMSPVEIIEEDFRVFASAVREGVAKRPAVESRRPK